MLKRAIGLTMLAFLLAGCNRQTQPLQVLPANPVHPHPAQPPADLMVKQCHFLDPSYCAPKKPSYS
jgi:PBP1b-binding outer membrane lipoprotein LpoB